MARAVSRACACSCLCFSPPCFVQFMKLWYVIYQDNFFLSHEKLYSHPYIDKWRYVSKFFLPLSEIFSHADDGRKWMTRMDDWWKWMTPWMTPHLYTIWSWMTPKKFVYYIVLICSQIFHSSSLAWMTMDDFWMTRHPCPSLEEICKILSGCGVRWMTSHPCLFFRLQLWCNNESIFRCYLSHFRIFYGERKNIL